jgi:hypothetical protein
MGLCLSLIWHGLISASCAAAHEPAPLAVQPQDGYRFAPEDAYIAPAAETLREYVDAVRQLPAAPRPAVYGLHDNADITCDQNEAYDMLATGVSPPPPLARSLRMPMCPGDAGCITQPHLGVCKGQAQPASTLPLSRSRRLGQRACASGPLDVHLPTPVVLR